MPPLQIDSVEIKDADQHKEDRTATESIRGGMPGVELKWEDVCYSVSIKDTGQGTSKPILRGVSGEMVPCNRRRGRSCCCTPLSL